MNSSAIDPEAFRQFELAAWEKKANAYHNFYRPVTSRLIEPLLNAAEVRRGVRLLDVATGPGYVAGRAAERGASVVGVDAAEGMLALARTLYPAIDFRQADAEHLPFRDSSFDAVVSNFIVPHLARPEAAVIELARVLAPGGRLALTTWDVPEKSRLTGVFVEAVEEAGASPPPSLPPGPPFARFADDSQFSRLLQSAGLEDVQVRNIAFTHRFASAGALWTGTLAAGVRTSALILGQTPEMRARIRTAFDRLVQDYVNANGLDVPASVKLASGLSPPTPSRG